MYKVFIILAFIIHLLRVQYQNDIIIFILLHDMIQTFMSQPTIHKKVSIQKLQKSKSHKTYKILNIKSIVLI